MIDPRSQGGGPWRKLRVAGNTSLVLTVVLASAAPLFSAGDEPVSRRSAPRWSAKVAPPNLTRGKPALAPTEARAAVFWSYGCAALAEFSNWHPAGFLPKRLILQSGLDAFERSGPWRGHLRVLEARLLVSMAETRLESATDRDRSLAEKEFQDALRLIASATERRTGNANLLSARAHLGLARLGRRFEERLLLCRQALRDLENANADHPQSWWLSGACHLMLADTLAFERHDFAGAREHYRRALPPLYRLRLTGPAGIESLAHWHTQVAVFSWQQGDPEKAEEHVLTAQALYAKACGSGTRHPLGVAQLEHLLALVALDRHGASEKAIKHLRTAWHAYQQPMLVKTGAMLFSTFEGPEGFDRAACGLQLADLVLAGGDLEDGLSLLDEVLAEDGKSARLSDRVLACLARSTVLEEQLGDLEQARHWLQQAVQLANHSESPGDRQLAKLWSVTRLAEMQSYQQSPQTAAEDLRRGLQGVRRTESVSAEFTLARARALHLLANLEAVSSLLKKPSHSKMGATGSASADTVGQFPRRTSTGRASGTLSQQSGGTLSQQAVRPSDQPLAERHYREALSAYQAALEQGAGSPGELGACYLDMAALQRPTPAGQTAALRLLHRATSLLTQSTPEGPENWYLLSEAHMALVNATLATGGNDAVALGHLDSAVETARKAVAKSVAGAHGQLARVLVERGQWELDRLGNASTSPELQSVVWKRAVGWLQEACATYRLGRENDVHASTLHDEVRCRLALAGLLWKHKTSLDLVAEQLAVTRELLDTAAIHDQGWHAEQARLDQFEANLLIHNPQTARQAATHLASAIGHYEQAIRLAEPEPTATRNALMAELEVVLFNLADFYATYLQDASGAVEWFRKNLALQEQMRMPAPEHDANQSLVLMRMGLVESQLRGDPDRAAEYYRESRERLASAQAGGVRETELVVRILVGLGMLGSQFSGLEQDAEQHFRDAVGLARSTATPSLRLAGFEYSARHGLAIQYERRGRYTEAADQMRRSIELGSMLKSDSLAEDRAYLESLSRLAQTGPSSSGSTRPTP